MGDVSYRSDYAKELHRKITWPGPAGGPLPERAAIDKAVIESLAALVDEVEQLRSLIEKRYGPETDNPPNCARAIRGG